MVDTEEHRKVVQRSRPGFRAEHMLTDRFEFLGTRDTQKETLESRNRQVTS